MNLLYIIPVFLGNVRGWQLLIIVLVVLLLFGGKKIPELMKGLGKGVHSFRQGIEEAKAEMSKPIEKHNADSESDKSDSTRA